MSDNPCALELRSVLDLEAFELPPVGEVKGWRDYPYEFAIDSACLKARLRRLYLPAAVGSCLEY